MKNILLIGLGRFGKHIAIQSSQLGHEIMAVGLDEERVNEALPYVTNAQIGDSTNEEFLKSLGIANYDICLLRSVGISKFVGNHLSVKRTWRQDGYFQS